ncbi:hypothetical protein DC74_6643 [Streptomyces noursei]|nr:hypothetical protein DC74_6643 [Streptomyces noursei]
MTGTGRAVPRVAGYAFAPQRRGVGVPGVGQSHEFRAGRVPGEGADDDPPGLQLLLHPLDPDRGVPRPAPQGGGQLRSVDLAGGLQPPQRQQRAVPLVQPAGGLGHLATLAGQAQPQDRQVHEVGAAIGLFHRLVQADDGVSVGTGPAAPHLVHGDRHQPGTEGRRLAQVRQRLQGAHHGLLHHVVDVRMAVQRPSHDVVDQGQVRGEQLFPGSVVTRPGRLHGRRTVFPLHACSFPFIRVHRHGPRAQVTRSTHGDNRKTTCRSDAVAARAPRRRRKGAGARRRAPARTGGHPLDAASTPASTPRKKIPGIFVVRGPAGGLPTADRAPRGPHDPSSPQVGGVGHR